MASDRSKIVRVAQTCAAPMDDLFHESLIFLAGIIGVIVVGLSTGTIDRFYASVTDATTDGIPWTVIMQQNPWIWPVGTILVIYLTALVAKTLRRSPRTTRLWLSSIAVGLGFVGGHVYWPSPGL